MRVNVGVIGTGMIGQYHIARLSSGLAGSRVVAVADLDASRARTVAAGIDGAEALATGQDLIRNNRVEAVVVTSWGPTHEEFVLAPIAAGKPVFCEKPLATDQEACLRIIDAETALGRRLVQVGFMRRFDPAYRALKETVASGAIGAPLIFHSAHRNASVPDFYTSDMTLTDTCVHDIDIARWLLDDEVAAVSVMRPRQNSRGRSDIQDPTLVLMEMARGVLVDIEISVSIGYGYDIRGEISGESGVAMLEESNPVVLKSEGAFHGTIPADWRVRFERAFDAEFREWLAAAAAGTAAGASAWDGYAATLVSDAALAAARGGQRVAIAMRDRPGLYSRSS